MKEPQKPQSQSAKTKTICFFISLALIIFGEVRAFIDPASFANKSPIHWIYPILLVYVIYYLVDHSTSKVETKQKDNKKSNGGVATFILYLLSYLPYLILFFTAISGSKSCQSLISLTGQGCKTVYGFEAMKDFLLFLSIMFPLYPTLLLFEVIYLIKNFKNLGQKRKIITLVAPAIIVVLLIIGALR